MLVKESFFNFKLQEMMDWNDKTFRDLWAMVTWNFALQVKYANILVLADIARCQCVSTATCERVFSVQNVIKTKFRTPLNTKHLKNVLRVATKGPSIDFDHILVVGIELWRNFAR